MRIVKGRQEAFQGRLIAQRQNENQPHRLCFREMADKWGMTIDCNLTDVMGQQRRCVEGESGTTETNDDERSQRAEHSKALLHLYDSP